MFPSEFTGEHSTEVIRCLPVFFIHLTSGLDFFASVIRDGNPYASFWMKPDLMTALVVSVELPSSLAKQFGQFNVVHCNSFSLSTHNNIHLFYTFQAILHLFLHIISRNHVPAPSLTSVVLRLTSREK